MPSAVKPEPPVSPEAPARLADCVSVSIAAAACSLILGWGFTVDDALISSRVAHHWISGLGYRFNPHGPITDCVTPLGWAALLAPLSGSGAWQGMLNARWLGALCHLLSAAVLGFALFRQQQALRWTALVSGPLALSLSLGAWASSGMETPLITLLVTLTLLEGKATLGAASLAAALRPELLPWAFVLGVTQPSNGPARRMLNVTLVLFGALSVALLRTWIFGQPAPLAVFAKPSDLAHGVQYAIGGFVLLGLPLLLVSRRGFGELSTHAKSIALALLAHLAAVVVAGGDWMALFRLLVPMLLCVAWLAATLLRSDWAALRWLKLAGCLAATALLLFGRLASTRSVLDNRTQLLASATPALTEARVVATLDVGWVGAAGEFEIVDLAGVTDPEIAMRPGGHTSKQVPGDLLYRRNVDTLVLLLHPALAAPPLDTPDWRELRFARQVEQRVTGLDLASSFLLSRVVALGDTGQHYAILRRLGERGPRRP